MKTKLVDLIKKAQANRSQTKFAMACELNPSTFTKIYGGVITPKADTLKKIAENSNGLVSFEELMNAAGYEVNNIENLDGMYLRLAKEAQELKLNEEDVDYIINFYKKYKR